MDSVTVSVPILNEKLSEPCFLMSGVDEEIVTVSKPSEFESVSNLNVLAVFATLFVVVEPSLSRSSAIVVVPSDAVSTSEIPDVIVLS